MVSESESERDSADGLGVVVAILALVGIIVVAIWVPATMQSVGEYRELSAVQVTQLYTQGIFWLLAAIGLLLFGLLLNAATR